MSYRQNKVLNYVIDVVGSRLTIPILWYLQQKGAMTYEQLREDIVFVTNTSLHKALKGLVDHGILKQEGDLYSISGSGEELIPILKEFVDWGQKQLHEQ